MVKLAITPRCCNQGVATSAMVSTVFDGVARHTPEGHAFVRRCQRARLPRGRQPPRRAVRRSRPQGVRGVAVVSQRPSPKSFARAHDRPVGRAERAARRPPGVGHRERTRSGSPADFDIREATVRVALTRMVGAGDLVRSADGYRLSDRLLARQRRQDDAMRPAAAHLGRRLDHVGRSPASAPMPVPALRCEPRCSTSASVNCARECGCDPTTWTRADADVGPGAGHARPRRRRPPSSPPGCGTCRSGSRTGQRLLDDMATATDIPGRFVRRRGHGAPPADRPGAARRTAARRLAGRRAARRPTTTSPPNWSRGATTSELMEAT